MAQNTKLRRQLPREIYIKLDDVTAYETIHVEVGWLLDDTTKGSERVFTKCHLLIVNTVF